MLGRPRGEITLVLGKYLTSIRTSVKGRNYVGGIAGYFWDSSLFECYEVTVVGSGSNIGGAVGASNITQSKVVSSTVEGTSTNSDYVGGLSGKHEWSMTGNFVEDTVVSSKGEKVGGIAGAYRSYTSSSSKNVVRGGSVTGYASVGGIVGYVEQGVINTSYTDTNVIAISKQAGGIAGGINNQTMDTATVGVRNCYVANSMIESKEYVGGLVGIFFKSLQGGYQYFYNNYVQADIIGDNLSTTSVGFGSEKNTIGNISNIYVYQYSTINGENITTENDPFIGSSQYLNEEELKKENTYKNQLGWGTNYTYTSLQQGKYPLINGLSNQEGIDLPKDSEHIIGGTNTRKEVSSITERLEEKELIEKFDYEQYEILLYEDSSKIINKETKEEVIRKDRIYVKEGNLYIIDENLEMVTNNVILDRYNGKEYETVLGRDGKIYDLKEPIQYPKKFKNEDIVSMDNNLHTEYKVTTVTYEDGSSIQFNYQTGEVLKEEKSEEKQLGIIDYIKRSLEKRNALIEDTKESYKESQNLVQALEEKPIEVAIQEKKKDKQNTEKIQDIQNVENIENLPTSISSFNEKKYITSYNPKTEEFEIYDEDEILNTKEGEVISENEKIEKNELEEYYTNDRIVRKGSGIIWISISIIGILITLGILWRRKNV